MFAYDTWGGSWGTSWGASWGTGSAPQPTQIPVHGYLPIYINKQAPKKHRRRQERAAAAIEGIEPEIIANEMRRYVDSEHRINLERATESERSTRELMRKLAEMKRQIAILQADADEDDEFLMMAL